MVAPLLQQLLLAPEIQTAYADMVHTPMPLKGITHINSLSICAHEVAACT